MSTRPLESHTDVFAERNHFLYACLGIVSAKQRLSKLLAKQARFPRSGPTLDVSQPFLLMVLGLVSLAKRAHTQIESWAAEAPPVPQRQPPPTDPCLRRLLK